MPASADRRRLIAALAAVLTPGEAPEQALVRAWLNGWTGLGLMRGWRATFYPSGLAHSIVAGTGWAPSPWRAVQQAAWAAVATK